MRHETVVDHLPGASPGNPIEVTSPVLVEASAAETPCIRCNGVVRVEMHQARIENGVSFRVAPVACRDCGFEREIYFRIASDLSVN